jgi:hypothetical protein
LKFWDPLDRNPTVDVFADYLMAFEKLFRAAILMPLPGTLVRVASLQRTPQQPREWLIEAPELDCQGGAIKQRAAGRS